MIALGIALFPVFVIAAIAYLFDGIAAEILDDDDDWPPGAT